MVTRPAWVAGVRACADRAAVARREQTCAIGSRGAGARRRSIGTWLARHAGVKLSALALALTAGALTMGAAPMAAPHPHDGAGLDARAAARNAGTATDAELAAAANTESAIEQEMRTLPWLRNFAASAEAAEAKSGVVTRMAKWRDPDPSCSASAYGGLEITADVAGAPSDEKVLASFTQGVLVLDAQGELLASATAPACQGSADELEAIAAGDAHIDRPVIALAVTVGGHREASTWLVLYRVVGGVVAPAFAGVVEERVGDQRRIGEVTLLPGALLYRAPSGTQRLWVYSAERQRYVELALVVPPDA